MRQCRLGFGGASERKTVGVQASTEDPAEVQEWIRQNNTAYIGLIAVGLVMLQPFLTARSLDLSGKVCVVAFALATPLLAALVMVNQHEAFRRRMTPSVAVKVTKAVAQAGFWHIEWFAGVTILAAGVVAIGIHSAGYARLERNELQELMALHETGALTDEEFQQARRRFE